MPFTMTQNGLVYSYNGFTNTWANPTFYNSVQDMVRSLLERHQLDEYNKMFATPFSPEEISGYAEYSVGRYVGKQACRNFKDLLGMWPKTFKKAYTYETIRLFGLEPYKKFIFRNRKLDSNYARDVYLNLPQLEELRKDGLMHLVPLVMATSRSPHNLKLLLGKSLWKSLARNSTHRNWLLYKATVDAYFSNDAMIREHFREHQVLPSTLLAQCPAMFAGRLYYAMLIYPTYKKAVAEYSSWPVTELADTVRMALQLDVPFKVQPYNAEYVSRKHAEFDRKIRLRQYSPEPFTHSFIYREGPWTVRKLISALEIADEGAAMHHCVASYVSECREGTYMVFSLTKVGERYATLGLDRRPHGLVDFAEWRFNQMYGHCNQSVEVENFDMNAFLLEVNRNA